MILWWGRRRRLGRRRGRRRRLRLQRDRGCLHHGDGSSLERSSGLELLVRGIHHDHRRTKDDNGGTGRAADRLATSRGRLPEDPEIQNFQ